MAELCRFYGMIVYMLFYDNKEHKKPHIHVKYGDYTASVGLDGELLAGGLPKKQMKLLINWIHEHPDELKEAWDLASHGENFPKIS